MKKSDQVLYQRMQELSKTIKAREKQAPLTVLACTDIALKSAIQASEITGNESDTQMVSGIRLMYEFIAYASDSSKFYPCKENIIFRHGELYIIGQQTKQRGGARLTQMLGRPFVSASGKLQVLQDVERMEKRGFASFQFRPYGDDAVLLIERPNTREDSFIVQERGKDIREGVVCPFDSVKNFLRTREDALSFANKAKTEIESAISIVVMPSESEFAHEYNEETRIKYKVEYELLAEQLAASKGEAHAT